MPAHGDAVAQQRRNRLAELPGELAARIGFAIIDLRALGVEGRDHGFARSRDRIRHRCRRRLRNHRGGCERENEQLQMSAIIHGASRFQPGFRQTYVGITTYRYPAFSQFCYHRLINLQSASRPAAVKGGPLMVA